MRTTESDEMDTLVSEQLASEIELMHNWGEKTRSGDNAISGFKADDTSGIAWLVVTKLRGSVTIPPGGISFSVRRVKWRLERSKWRSNCL